MLEKVEPKFKAGYYHEVIQILTSIFDDSSSWIEPDSPCPPRHTQLLMLIESLSKIGNVKVRKTKNMIFFFLTKNTI